jgi:putative ABC transport system ATP-binding protein
MPFENPRRPDGVPPDPKGGADEMLFLFRNLAVLTDTAFEPAAARQAIEAAVSADDESLEQVVSAASGCGLRVVPARLSVADAVWRARADLPLVAWSPVRRTWLIITGDSWFRARLVRTAGGGRSERISRGELARVLGLRSSRDEADFGVVHAQRSVEMANGRNPLGPEVAPSHGHSGPAGHHEEIPPWRRFLGLLRAEMPDIRLIVVYSLALAATARGMQYYLSDVIQRRLFVRLTADLSYRLPRVQLSCYDGIHAPELMNRFLDIVTVQKTTAFLLLEGINVVLGSVIGMVVLAFYHPFLLAFDACIIVIVMLIVFIFGRNAVRTSIVESRSKYAVVHWLEELARYPAVFKGPGGYALAAERADQLALDYLHARRSHFRILIRQIAGFLGLEVLATTALLVIGGWLVLNMELTLGQLVASELIVGTLVAAIAKLGKQFEAWYDAMAAMDKLGHLVDLSIEREDGEAPSFSDEPASVAVENVAYGYQEGHPVVEELGFRLAPGERVAITGPHGSGSSTVLALLSGLRAPDSGVIRIDGIDLRSWRLESLRSQVALVRNFEILEGTVVDNVRLGRADIRLDEVREAMARAGLLEEIMALPDGLNTVLVTGGRPLSSRQCVRLLIARAMVTRPRLLLLDEVLDGLGDDDLRELAPQIFGPQHPWTVLVATREPAVMALCDKIVRLAPPGGHFPVIH